jgi:hypothetical protein
MKTRTGFVSNSSSSSFCIYGWECKTWDESNELSEKLQEFMPTAGDIISVRNRHEHVVVGVGNWNTEFDHYMDDWESYECDYPSDEYRKCLDKIATQLGMSKPQIFSDTWFDG